MYYKDFVSSETNIKKKEQFKKTALYLVFYELTNYEQLD